MFQLFIDFDAIRERAVDAIFAGAGHLSNVVEDALDAVETFVDRVNDAAE